MQAGERAGNRLSFSKDHFTPCFINQDLYKKFVLDSIVLFIRVNPLHSSVYDRVPGRIVQFYTLIPSLRYFMAIWWSGDRGTTA